MKYIIKEVNDWLNRIWTFREEEVSDELLKQWIKTTHDVRVNDIQVINKMLDINPASYMPYTWQ